MDDKKYAMCALTLALTGIVFAAFPIIIPILSIPFYILTKGHLRLIFGIPTMFGWIPGTVIAIFALRMGQHMKGSILLINVTRITAVLALLGNLGFGIIAILALLLIPYKPGW